MSRQRSITRHLSLILNSAIEIIASNMLIAWHCILGWQLFVACLLKLAEASLQTGDFLFQIYTCYQVYLWVYPRQ